MNSIGIIVFFTIVLATASFASLTIVAGPQQAMAKSSSSVMKSLIANTTRIGVLSMPITCNSLGDIMGALSGVLGNATAAGGGGGNETSSMQGMMASGMQNMSQSKLQHLNNLVFCSLANEKTIRSLMK
jgi:hypothetical protein